MLERDWRFSENGNPAEEIGDWRMAIGYLLMTNHQ